MHVDSHLQQQRCSQFSYSPRAEDCLRRQMGDFHGTPPGDDSQTNTTSLMF